MARSAAQLVAARWQALRALRRVRRRAKRLKKQNRHDARRQVEAVLDAGELGVARALRSENQMAATAPTRKEMTPEVLLKLPVRTLKACLRELYADHTRINFFLNIENIFW